MVRFVVHMVRRVDAMVYAPAIRFSIDAEFVVAMVLLVDNQSQFQLPKVNALSQRSLITVEFAVVMALPA